jgi:putative endopeptidase
MRLRNALAIAVLGVLVVAGPQAQPLRSRLDVTGFDRSVLPQDDLYRYVNGGWLTRVAMPGDRVSYGAFAEISDRTELDLRAIIEDVSARPNRPRGSAAQQIADHIVRTSLPSDYQIFTRSPGARYNRFSGLTPNAS